MLFAKVLHPQTWVKIPGHGNGITQLSIGNFSFKGTTAVKENCFFASSNGEKGQNLLTFHADASFFEDSNHFDTFHGKAKR